MNENSSWRKAIAAQTREFPAFKKMLADATGEHKASETENIQAETHFLKQLALQEKKMQQINHAIDLQQKRLALDCENEGENKYDIDTLCTQDILRERIKEIEKNYIDLKCNFMNYLSTLL